MGEHSYKIRVEETVTYEIDVMADTIEEALEIVAEGEDLDMIEKDSSGLDPIEYTLPGQMGWNQVSEMESES